MIIPALDIVATAGFAVAFLAALGAVLFTRDLKLTVPALFLLGAAAVMALVSALHTIERLGVGKAPDISEDYIQALFLPFAAYLMYSLFTRSRDARAARERRVVDRLDHRLEQSLDELGEYRLGMLQALNAAVDARDHYTAMHSMHVADYACAVGYRLGMKDRVDRLEQAGLLHDVGKIGVPDKVLLKPARLNADEYESIKRHVRASASIIESVSFLSDIVPMVLHHHERWDGTGYPDGLAGERIPLAARILAVADAFDAMTTDRPYRPAMEVERAKAVLLEARGTQFDPAVVDEFVGLIDAGLIVVDHGRVAV